MNLTLPGVSTPTHTSTSASPRAAVSDASRPEPAANAQRFGQAMREARPKAAPTPSAPSTDGTPRADAAADERADASVDTTTPGAATSSPGDPTGRATDSPSEGTDGDANHRASHAASDQPPPSDAAQTAAADWLNHLPAQSAPIGLNLSLVTGLHMTGPSPADRGGDAGTQAGTDATAAARTGEIAMGGDAAGTAARTAPAASLASSPATRPADALPSSSPSPAAADATAPSALASTALSSRNPGEAPQDSASRDTPRAADATPRTSGDWQLALGRSPAAAPSAPFAPSGTVTLASPQPTQWREPMLNALGEHVQWQQQRGIDQAVIRLEPPQMGRIDIVIRQDASGLQVQLSATHREVAQQLHAVSDSLRQDLGQRQSLNVSVQVSDASRHDAPGQGGQGGQRSRQPQDSDHRSPHRALQDADGGTSSTAFALHPEQG